MARIDHRLEQVANDLQDRVDYEAGPTLVRQRVELEHGWAVTLTKDFTGAELDRLGDQAASEAFELFHTDEKAGAARYALSCLYLNA